MRNDTERRGPYRSRRGRLFGVCRGLAEYFGVRTLWLRLGVIALAVVSGVWPVLIAYILAAFLLRPEPVVDTGDEGERDFYDSWASSRPAAVRRLKERFESLDRRIRRMEDVVTSREYDWDRRFDAGR